MRWSSGLHCSSGLSRRAHRWRDGRLLLTAARDRLRKLSAPVRLDLSVGDEGDNTDSTTAFAKILDELKPAGLDYRFTVYRGENHNSVRLVSFPAGLYWVYRPARQGVHVLGGHVGRATRARPWSEEPDLFSESWTIRTALAAGF